MGSAERVRDALENLINDGTADRVAEARARDRRRGNDDTTGFDNIRRRHGDGSSDRDVDARRLGAGDVPEEG